MARKKEVCKKGLTMDNLDEIAKVLQETTTVVEPINSGKYDNGNAFITIKIEYKT